MLCRLYFEYGSYAGLKRHLRRMLCCLPFSIPEAPRIRRALREESVHLSSLPSIMSRTIDEHFGLTNISRTSPLSLLDADGNVSLSFHSANQTISSLLLPTAGPLDPTFSLPQRYVEDGESNTPNCFIIAPQSPDTGRKVPVCKFSYQEEKMCSPDLDQTVFHSSSKRSRK